MKSSLIICNLLLITAVAAGSAGLPKQQHSLADATRPELAKPHETTPEPPRKLLATTTAAASPHHQHKNLSPVAASDVVFFVLSFLVLSLAAGAGVGGGVLLVPMLSLITGFGPIPGAALSNIAIFSGALVNMAFNLPRKNPLKAGPIIDYDLLLLFGPPVIMGSVGGSYMNMVIPGWITRVLLLALLLPMTQRMVQKAQVLFKKETAARKAAAAAPAAVTKAPTLKSLSSFSLKSFNQHAHADDNDDDDDPRAFQHTELTTVIEGKSCDGPTAGTGEECGEADDEASRYSNQDVERGLQPPVSAFAACPTQQHHRQQHQHQHDVHHTASPSLSKRGSSRELIRSLSKAVSTGLHEAAHLSLQSSIAEAFGPELIYVSEGDASEKAGAIGRALSRRLSRRRSSLARATGKESSAGTAKDMVIDADSKDAAVGGLSQQAAVSSCKKRHHTNCLHTPDLDDKMATKIERKEAAQLPPLHLALMLLLFATVCVTSICAQELLSCGSAAYFAVALLPLPITLLVWLFMRWYVLQKAGWKAFFEMMHPADIPWTPLTTITWPAVCISAGIVAGLLGLGGGTILAPLMLEMHVPPRTAVATSQATLLISSCTSSIVYMINGSMPWDYGIAMVIIGVTGTLFGQLVVNWVVSKTGRTSMLVIVLAVLFVLACCAATAALAKTIAQIVSDPTLLTSIRHVCIR